MSASVLTVCPGCGGKFPAVPNGTVHRYMESSPGCWTAYGEILAREYTRPEYFRAHEFTVDAYAVQHPGQPSPQSIRSVAVHLIRLCLMLEHDVTAEQTAASMQAAARRKDAYHWLEPPTSRGAITAAEVRRPVSAEEQAELVRKWATSAWNAWASHHKTVRAWLPEPAGGRAIS